MSGAPAAAHALEPDEASGALGADARRGLSEKEATVRLARHGPNRLPRRERPAYLELAGRQLLDPLVALLVAAAAVSAAIGDGLEAAAIGAIVLLNGTLGFSQEAAAERAVLSLRGLLTRRARVVRAGRERELDAEEVALGDLLVLGEGERVCADARVVSSEGLEVDESALTGESLPVEKSPRAVAADAPLAERASMVFAGTAVTRGRARAVVTAIGESTELGLISRLAAAAMPPPTPLQMRIGGLARTMVALGAVLTGVLAGGMLLHGSAPHQAFLVGVAVAVAAVPEGLAATVTIALSFGARELARRGAIVRRLSAIETLGQTTAICADKTGTLTENRLRLAEALPVEGSGERELLAAAVLASSAELVETGEGAVRVAGDPVEAALLLAAMERGASRDDLLAGRERVSAIPFEPARRRMTVVYAREDGGLHAFVKGAPEAVLERSLLAPRERRRLAAAAGEWAREGLRVLAIAERRLDAPAPPDEALERDLAPLGLVALHDPLRPSAPAAIEEVRAAGLAVWMLTGDHPETARTIGHALGLPAETILARVSPAEKLALVERLQREGEVVAVTGDGVNDAPALRRADVGIAMGRAGTEAAREAAAIVLTDDEFATIAAALREGRRIADAVRKAIAFLLSANLGEVVLFALAVLAGLGAPMTVVQVLTINVLTDGLPALALARDPASRETMARGPRRVGSLLPRPLAGALAGVGLVVGAAGLGAYLLGRAADGAAAQTMAFATVALAELGLAFSCRSVRAAAWRLPANPSLAASVLLSAALLGLALFLPPLHAPFGTTALAPWELAAVLGLAVLPLLATELAKALARRAAGRAR